ncbi:MAG: polysaccharide export protein [Gemmatimonadaceae bacterium]|nr:polysaccharide export protein [Gemmatimonadaceae bacterium]
MPTTGPRAQPARLRAALVLMVAMSTAACAIRLPGSSSLSQRTSIGGGPGARTNEERLPYAAGATQAPLVPGDVIRIRVWREPELSGEFVVDRRGIVTLPRLGAMNVSALEPEQLREQLTDAYAPFLRDPSIEVTPLRRIRVLGAVRTPGLYSADPTMSVRDVLALAGGATPDGRDAEVRLDRGGRSMVIPLWLGGQEVTLRSGDQLVVEQRAWLSRNVPLVAAIVSVGGGLAISLLAR